MKGLVEATRGVRWGAAVAGAVCIVFAVVGCGSEAVEGSPTTATQSGQPSFDPCTLPDEALVGVGVDPGTRQEDAFGVRYEGWALCTWAGDWFYLSVFATSHGIGDVRTNPRNTDFAPVEVGSRKAFTYREVSDETREHCDVAIGSDTEVMLVRISKKGSEQAADDPCNAAVVAARTLDPYLPPT